MLTSQTSCTVVNISIMLARKGSRVKSACRDLFGYGQLLITDRYLSKFYQTKLKVWALFHGHERSPFTLFPLPTLHCSAF